MSRFQLTEHETRIFDLEGRLKRLEDFARAHEALEAAMLTDGGSWADEMLEQFRDEFERVQKLRNQALRV